MTATFSYFPFDGGPGADSSEPQWVDMFTWMRTTGILSTNVPLDPSADDLAVTPGSGLEVQIAVGQAWMQGTYFSQTDDYSYYSITANDDPDGYDRIDLFVLETDFTANVTQYVNVEGTPAASPVAPTPTQNSMIWQLPLATLNVAYMATFFNPGDITDERIRSVQGPSSFLSSEETGTGSTQAIAHGLGVTPFAVVITPTDTTDAGIISGGYTTSYTADATNVTVTATSNLKYVVQAWAIGGV